MKITDRWIYYNYILHKVPSSNGSATGSCQMSRLGRWKITNISVFLCICALFYHIY